MLQDNSFLHYIYLQECLLLLKGSNRILEATMNSDIYIVLYVDKFIVVVLRMCTLDIHSKF